MRYFIDCEFLEGKQKERFPINLFRKETPNTIDLISIALVSEDNREFYAISKDFNLKEAWNRYDTRKEWYSIDESTQSTRDVKVYWIRENVLKPIFEDLVWKDYKNVWTSHRNSIAFKEHTDKIFTYDSFKKLLNKYGKTNKQIAEEIIGFVYPELESAKVGYSTNAWIDRFLCLKSNAVYKNPQFYAYYGSYDFVALCWLFGKMIDLPNGFPYYCNDLKQELDNYVEKERIEFKRWKDEKNNNSDSIVESFNYHLEKIKSLPNYPKQTNEHSAIHDARWNRDLHKFLKIGAK